MSAPIARKITQLGCGAVAVEPDNGTEPYVAWDPEITITTVPDIELDELDPDLSRVVPGPPVYTTVLELEQDALDEMDAAGEACLAAAEAADQEEATGWVYDGDLDQGDLDCFGKGLAEP